MSTLPDGLRLDLATEADLPALAEVLAACFPDNPKADPDVLRWQYLAPFGPLTVAIVRDVEDGDRIVGQWAAITLPALLGRRPGLIARTADAAILPSHRGRGLWPVLARHLFGTLAQRGVPLALSSPNDQSVTGLEQVGWTPLGAMHAHILVTSDQPLGERVPLPAGIGRLARRAAFRVPRSRHEAREIPGTPPDADQLWRRLTANVTHGVVRNSEWLGWRYEQRPGAGYRWWEVRDRAGSLAGLAVAASRQQRGVTFADVVELLAVDQPFANALVAAMRDDLGNDVAGLAIGALDDSRLATTVEAAGFRRLPGSLAGKALRAGGVDTTGTRPDLLTADWSLQWGDMDHL